MKLVSKKSFLISLAVLAGIVLVANLVLAWTTPTADPPASNLPAPINEGSDTQTKSGGLNISGNVGIGTTAPTKAKLQVMGNLYLGGEASDDTRIIYPSHNLYIQNEGYAHPNIHIRPGGSTSGNLYSSLGLYASDTASPPNYTEKILLATGGNSYFNGGNVGIGTTNPGYKLDVNGTVRFIGSVGNTQFDGTGARIQFTRNSANYINATGDSGYLSFGTGGTANQVVIRESGNVGIATTTPNALLDIQKVGTGDLLNVSSDTAGDLLTIDNSGNVGIGTTAPSEKLEVNGNVKASAFYYSSDRRLKENIRPLSDSLDKIKKLQGVSFDWKKDGEKSIGLIAQDVEKIFPELVKTDPNSGLKSIQYAQLVSPLIEAVKEQQRIINQQDDKINQQQEEIDQLKSEWAIFSQIH